MGKVGKAPTIAGTGLICLDIVLSGSKEDAQYIQAGGSAANVLSIMAGLSWRATAIGRHQPNEISDFIRADLENFGVDLAYLKLDPAGSTPIIIQVNKDEGTERPSHRFHWRCPDCGGWLPRFKPPTLDLATKYLDEVPPPLAFYYDRAFPAAVRIAEELRQKGTIIVFEPNSLRDDRIHERAIQASDIIKYSHERVKDDVEPLLSGSPGLLVETMGEDGLQCFLDDEWVHLPAVQAPFIIDSVGSGDWTTAGMIHQLVMKSQHPDQWTLEDVLKAARFGQGLAALNCAFVGARGVQYEMAAEDIVHTAWELVNQTSNKDLIKKRLSSCGIVNRNTVCPSCDWMANQTSRKPSKRRALTKPVRKKLGKSPRRK